jgi:hypothetical protein
MRSLINSSTFSARLRSELICLDYEELEDMERYREPESEGAVPFDALTRRRPSGTARLMDYPTHPLSAASIRIL